MRPFRIRRGRVTDTASCPLPGPAISLQGCHCHPSNPACPSDHREADGHWHLFQNSRSCTNDDAGSVVPRMRGSIHGSCYLLSLDLERGALRHPALMTAGSLWDMLVDPPGHLCQDICASSRSSASLQARHFEVTGLAARRLDEIGSSQISQYP